MIQIKKATMQAKSVGIDLSLLNRQAGIADGANLGGQFALPQEFDRQTLASGFYKKGTGVDAARQRQTLAGTEFSADGWNVWKFPEGHECEGKTHEVTVSDGTYVLMYRDIGVQEAANYVFGEASRSRMNAEVNGETVAGNSLDDPGVLTEERLNQIPSLRAEQQSIDAERNADQRSGRDVSTFAGQKGKLITKKIKKLSR